jgi:hypothetical protein
MVELQLEETDGGDALILVTPTSSPHKRADRRKP